MRAALLPKLASGELRTENAAMPFEIKLEEPLIGYALSSGREGDMVDIVFREFTSTEDGQYFIQRLEGISHVLQSLPSPINPSQIDNMLIVCHPDGRTIVYVNELEQRLSIRTARSVKDGTAVTKDDIADIEYLEIGVQIPIDVGFVFLFSIGWRKGLLYDFGPIGLPKPQIRQYDITRAFGQAYCHILFQERFSISDKEWNALFEEKWFPFVGFRNETITTLINHIRSGWSPDEMIGDIISEIKERVPQMLDNWRARSSLSPHIQILERAIDRFLNDDYVSCTGLLFPRIEGILRTHHRSSGSEDHPSQKNLSRYAIATKIQNQSSLLLPHRFREYLDKVYFQNFDPNISDPEISRNSIAHGVASALNFNSKSTTISILIIDQLFYFLQSEKSPASDSSETR